LLDQVREAIRLKHYSLRTEHAYIDWIKRFIIFHGKQHPEMLGADAVREFLSDLASSKNVAASTQNQAFSALLFLYREVLKLELPWIDNIERAKRPPKIPVVFTPDEARTVLSKLQGTARLMAHLLYGSGLRLMECLRLRIKDIDFGYLQITVRDGKGGRDRVTMLPISLVDPLRRQIEKRRVTHEEDLARCICRGLWQGKIRERPGTSRGNIFSPLGNVRPTRAMTPSRLWRNVIMRPRLCCSAR